MEPPMITFEGITKPTPDVTNAPGWRLAGPGSVGAYCDVGCGTFRPIAYDASDLVCAVCWGVLLTLGEVARPR
jgi:hypothetical protein